MTELVADVVFGSRSLHEVEPIAARLLFFLGRQDIDDFGILDMVVERYHLSACFSAGGSVADLAVDGIGEVDRRGFFG